MTLQGYGDDYGNRYAEVYSTEVVQTTATATVNSQETARAFESGVVTVGGLVTGTKSRGYGDNYGLDYGESFADGGPELAFAFESGLTTATPTVQGAEIGVALETPSISVVASPSINAVGRAFESGGLQASATPAIDSRSIVLESGAISADATLRYSPFVFVKADDPVGVFKSIFNNIASQFFTLPRPDVFAMWDLDPQQRLKNPDPAVYIWSPTAGSLDRFSADGDLTTDSRTVEIMVMTYSDSETHRYTEDLIEIISPYVDDNTELTIFEDVDAVGVADERGDHIFGESNHYINTVEVEIQRLRSTNDI